MMIAISKFVMVFLSWLNGTLSVLPLGTVIGIFYGTGLFMFLLPPVPGVPVYVLGGVVLVNSFKRAGYSFGVGLFAVSMICWAIKLNAVAMQQKLIGGQMSGSLYVRKTVAVNSIAIKATGTCSHGPTPRISHRSGCLVQIAQFPSNWSFL